MSGEWWTGLVIPHQLNELIWKTASDSSNPFDWLSYAVGQKQDLNGYGRAFSHVTESAKKMQRCKDAKSYTLFAHLLICSFAHSGSFVNKIDPVLKPLLWPDFVASLRPGSTSPSPRDGAYPFLSYQGSHSRPAIKAILKVSHSPFALRTLGVNVRSVINSVEYPPGFLITADIPLEVLGRVAEQPNVLYIHAARRAQLLAPALDKSVPDTGADRVWNGNPGYTGKDVIVGFIDTGIDWPHEDFKEPDGSSRILFIWDQTVTTNGRSPDDYAYGTEWPKRQIEAGLCTQRDFSGHGTHLASIAAGNGRGTGVQHSAPRFIGMAPEADIIAVKSFLFEDDVLDATRYIFEKAEMLGKPAVVNLSFAYQSGPHDGRTLLEDGLNQLVQEKPGRAIVAGAGNRGESSIHAGDVLLAPQGENYPKLILNPDLNASSVFITLWYSARDSIDVRVRVPKNFRGDITDFDWVSPGQGEFFDVPNGPWRDAIVVVDSATPHPVYPDLNSISIWMWNGGDISLPLHQHRPIIELDGPGVAFDAYYFSNQLDGGFKTRGVDPWMIPGDAEKTVGMPSTADNVLSVASYVTRNQWIDRLGIPRAIDSTVDEISSISSLGPRRDGEEKPDLAAPGEIIIGALSRKSWGNPPLIHQDGSHFAQRGSSLAAAHVTGAVALLLQQEPSRTVEELKRLLLDSVSDRGSVGWDATWGAGRLNVPRALNVPSIPLDVQAVAQDGAVELNWEANLERNIAGYKLYFSSRVLNLGDVQTFRLTELQNDVPLSISLTAYNTEGRESPKTRPIIVTPTKATGADRTSPTAPVGLVVTAGNQTVDLQWTPNHEPDVAGYLIYLGFASENYQPPFNVTNRTQRVLIGAPNDVPLYLAISAYDRVGNESEKSQEVEVTPKPVDFKEISQQAGWPFQTQSEVYSSPVPFDLDGDGDLEVILGARDGLLYAWHHDGTRVAGWPLEIEDALVTTPAIGDLDGDGQVEIVLSAERSVYIWKSDGTPFSPKWPKKFKSPIIASPVLADLDNDFDLEIILVTKKDGVHVLHHSGKEMKGWPQTIEGWGFSSAAVGDLDLDKSLEIVVTTGRSEVYAWHADGKPFPGWPIVLNASSGANAPPVLGDLDGDGVLEIVVTYRSGSIYVLPPRGKVLKGWPVQMGHRHQVKDLK